MDFGYDFAGKRANVSLVGQPTTGGIATLTFKLSLKIKVLRLNLTATLLVQKF